MSHIGHIHSIETCGTTDGPGIRYILFLQGCMMRCKYCHNRDTWPTEGGYRLSVEKIMKDVARYRRFFRASGGGITASGGEPTLQAAFIVDLFRAAQKAKIHTALDTNGYILKYTKNIKEMLKVTDLVLLDIKGMDDAKHTDLTSISNKYSLEFARYLAKKNKPTWIRYLILPGYTDAKEDIQALGEFLQPMKNIQRIELNRFHQMGEHKWEVFADDYELSEVKPPTQKRMDKVASWLEPYGIEVVY